MSQIKRNVKTNVNPTVMIASVLDTATNLETLIIATFAMMMNSQKLQMTLFIFSNDSNDEFEEGNGSNIETYLLTPKLESCKIYFVRKLKKSVDCN